MGIEAFIRDEVLRPRLNKAEVLVVYDGARRYDDLCLDMADEHCQVVDASESSIESREAALAALRAMGRLGAQSRLLVYVPADPPLTDEAKLHDPFALYGACGAVFPASDGDRYESLCMRAKADHGAEIRRIFAQDPDPAFAVIDAVGAGGGWPTLQAALGVQSARDILQALLAPTDAHRAALAEQNGWVAEVKRLCRSAMGLTLQTKVESWSNIADELWRYLLFSEYALNLPTDLPSALADVPRADEAVQPLVADLCDNLRNDLRTRELYVRRAIVVEEALRLAEHSADMEDVGPVATFAWQDDVCFAQAVEALQRDNLNLLRDMLVGHQGSVWLDREKNQARWSLLEAAAKLAQVCADGERTLADHAASQRALLDGYTGGLYQIDRLQRQFEEQAGAFFGGDDQVAAVLHRARQVYRKVAAQMQAHFMRHLEDAGWPSLGYMSNSQVADELLVPALRESGHRVALFMIDALRYELGVELSKELGDGGQIELRAACAVLPTVTTVGMASLLPGAAQNLKLVKQGNGVVPALGQDTVTTVAQRMGVLRARYGERFAEAPLADFCRGHCELASTVDLLVLRSNEMDAQFESNPETAPTLIRRTFKQITSAVAALRQLGFHELLIATDHGFFLNGSPRPGDVGAKPEGDWIAVHGRMLLGDGTGHVSNYVLPASHLGIRGDFEDAAGPRTLVGYHAGQSYLHGGASLQEAVVPVLTMQLEQTEKAPSKPIITLSYREGATSITSRIPMLTVTAQAGDLFSVQEGIKLRIEAQDKGGNVVGEPRQGERVSPVGLIVTVQPGETLKLGLRMAEEYEGPFTVKALDPSTGTIYDQLDLATDYLV